ncbi:MAG: hypothetical protein II980_02915 [Clostridia bacterium]|nr:hypothetical protein [Clostridia bacterium]
MKRVDKVVLQETLFVGAWTLILSLVMQAIFLIISWDYTVLFGNLLGALAGIFNFFLLGLTIQRATKSGDVKYAKTLMKLSQAGRMILLLVVGVLGAVLSCFNIWAVLISLFFPRIAFLVRPLFYTREQKKALKEKKEEGKDGDVLEEE